MPFGGQRTATARLWSCCMTSFHLFCWNAAFVHIIINSNDVVISSSATFCKICFFSRTFSIFRVVLILLKEGVPMKQIQEWLGHSDISTTANIYAHLDSQSKNLSARTMANTLTLPEAQPIKKWWFEQRRHLRNQVPPFLLSICTQAAGRILCSSVNSYLPRLLVWFVPNPKITTWK